MSSWRWSRSKLFILVVRKEFRWNMISNTYPKCFLYFLCFPKSQRILHRSIYCQIHQLVSTPLLTEINKESGICCEETKRHKMPSLQSLTNANRGGLAYVLVVYAYVKIAHLSKYHLLVRAKRVCLVRRYLIAPVRLLGLPPKPHQINGLLNFSRACTLGTLCCFWSKICLRFITAIAWLPATHNIANIVLLQRLGYPLIVYTFHLTNSRTCRRLNKA